MLRIACSLVFCILFTISYSQTYQEQIDDFWKAKQATLYNGERVPLESEEDIKDLRYYEAKEDYQVMAKVSLTPEAKPFEMATYSGITKTYIKYAELSLKLNGQDVRLSLYKNLLLANNPLYKDHLFLPFMDLTNGVETYGGGRYLDIKISDIRDGTLNVNFNKASPPWCASSDGFNCPIPPLENRLEIEIHAGEKNFVGKKKKREVKE